MHCQASKVWTSLTVSSFDLSICFVYYVFDLYISTLKYFRKHVTYRYSWTFSYYNMFASNSFQFFFFSNKRHKKFKIFILCNNDLRASFPPFSFPSISKSFIRIFHRSINSFLIILKRVNNMFVLNSLKYKWRNKKKGSMKKYTFRQIKWMFCLNVCSKAFFWFPIEIRWYSEICLRLWGNSMLSLLWEYYTLCTKEHKCL